MDARVLSRKGAQTQIVVETQGLVFTPDNLMSVLKDNEFQIAQGNVPNPLHPDSPPQNTQIYSKDSMMIVLLQNPPLFSLFFTIINSIDLREEKVGDKSGLEMIRGIMDSLSLVDETISAITFNFTTRFAAANKPMEQLTKILSEEFKNKIKKVPSLSSLKLLSIRLGDVFPIEKEGINIVFEPFLSNTEKMFFLQFTKKVRNRDSLFDLIDKFPEILDELIRGVDSSD